MITRELTQFHRHTCLSLANCSAHEEFVAHSSVQHLLSDVWTGTLKTREVSTSSLILAMFWPPLIWKFDFRNTEELKTMVHVGDDANAKKEEDTELENKSSVNEVVEVSE